MLTVTKGIVLRTVKYGETSVIVSIFTEIYGAQSYIVNGVRSNSKSAQGKSALYQPGSILELTVYHNDGKNLQRIREARWSYLYQNIFFDVRKNAVALFFVELLQKCLRQPEPLPDLFYFAEDLLMALDHAGDMETANLPLFAATHLPGFFGMRIDDNYSVKKSVLDLRDGVFTEEIPLHPHYLTEPNSGYIAELLRTRQPSELSELLLNREQRQLLLRACQDFYVLHLPEFGTMRSLQVLQAILNDA